MTNKKSLTPADVANFRNLSLCEIEAAAKKLRDSTTPGDHDKYRAARQALSARQREIKAAVMDFENSNDHHLLFYDSTADFVKLAGNSVLFFSACVAPRLRWRFSIKSDTDHYSVSKDGVISIRSFDHLTAHLAQIQILPDSELSSPDLHYFTLAKVYTNEQIAEFRDRINEKAKRIATAVLPNSPMPELYTAISKAAELIYNRFKNLPNSLTRNTIGADIVSKSYQLTVAYLDYANTPKDHSLSYLAQIIKLSRNLRFSMSYLSQVKILHQNDIFEILEQLNTVTRLSSQAYKRATKQLAAKNV